MSEVKVGLIPAPGMPEKRIKKLIDPLPELLNIVIDDKVDWQIDYETNPLVSSAEFINEGINQADEIREKNGWDMAIAVTDLPSLSNKKVVISEFGEDKEVSIIYLPALGMFNHKKKLQNLILHHIEIFYGHESSENSGAISSQFINKVTEVTPEEDNDSSKRYIIKSTVTGWIRLVIGMIYINEPWTVLTGFKKIVSLAFATGTYVSIFSGAWDLSLEYTSWRFLLGMFISIFGMTAWLIHAHKLWEKTSQNSQKLYRSLYNLTTLGTVMSVTVVNYAIVYLLLTISILLFVPPGLFNSWTSVEAGTGLHDYFNLIWFASSLGILAGALGSTVEDEDKIRNITYSYRQLYRKQQFEDEEDEVVEESSEAEDTKARASETQEHDETEENQSQGEVAGEGTEDADGTDEDESEYEGEKQTHRESEEDE